MGSDRDAARQPRDGGAPDRRRRSDRPGPAIRRDARQGRGSSAVGAAGSDQIFLSGARPRLRDRDCDVAPGLRNLGRRHGRSRADRAGGPADRSVGRGGHGERLRDDARRRHRRESRRQRGPGRHGLFHVVRPDPPGGINRLYSALEGSTFLDGQGGRFVLGVPDRAASGSHGPADGDGADGGRRSAGGANRLEAARPAIGRRRMGRRLVAGARGRGVGAGRASSRAELAKAIYDAGLPRGALGHAYFQSKWVEGDFETLGGTRRLSLDGLASYGHGQDKPNPVPVPRQNTFAPDADVWRYSLFVWAPCVNVVGLTVDTTTGRVQIENVLSVLNAGRVYVPELVSGQSQGGVAMAIGYTLFEDMPVGMAGPANGRWNLDKYHVPRAEDLPLSASYAPGRRAQELIVMPETPGDNAEGRGIAEAVMCSVAPAISNAIRDAVGRRFASLPITPAKVLQ